MFPACVAVNVETGDMLLTIAQNGEFVWSLSSAVAPSRADECRSAHWRLCALDAPGCFPFLYLTTCCAVHVCARSQRLSSDSSDYTLAQVKKSDYVELCACAAHFLNLVAERWAPDFGSN